MTHNPFYRKGFCVSDPATNGAQTLLTEDEDEAIAYAEAITATGKYASYASPVWLYTEPGGRLTWRPRRQ